MSCEDNQEFGIEERSKSWVCLAYKKMSHWGDVIAYKKAKENVVEENGT